MWLELELEVVRDPANLEAKKSLGCQKCWAATLLAMRSHDCHQIPRP